MTVFLDSYCWFEYYFGTQLGRKVAAIIESNEEILTSPIVVFEVYRKHLAQRPDKALGVKQFLLARATTVKLDEATAALAAELSVKHHLHTTDALIYATAIKNNAVLITGDAHFKELPKTKRL